MVRFDAARAVIDDAIASRVCPAAAVEVGTAAGPIWREVFGRLTYAPDAPATRRDTLFDLASLTKVIATGTLVMRLVDGHRLSVSDPVARWLPDWRGADRAHVTVRDLLAHTSGLSAWLPLYRDCQGRQDFQPSICGLPLEFAPRTQALYSDLGFMLLGFIVADAGRAALSEQFAETWGLIRGRGTGDAGPEREEEPGVGACLQFAPGPGLKANIAPTAISPWRGRLLAGEVDDENAWALGGVAGHSGLFGNVAGVGLFARWLLNARQGSDDHEPPVVRAATVNVFTTRLGDPGSSRALGWDTMLPTSSCGTRMSPTAFGHTGFTGTSLWLDPEAGSYTVLLTNRVHPSRQGEKIRQVRPAFHDAVIEALGLGSREQAGAGE